MSIQTKGREQLIRLLNEWYEEIRLYHVEKSNQLKMKIEENLKEIETDQYLSLYYSLLDFRCKVLVEGINITKESFEKVEELSGIKDQYLFLAYYYHFFKAIHSTILSNYNDAKAHYDKAEELLIYIPDEIEKAEFEYRMASFYYHSYQPFEGIQHVLKAKEMFSNHIGYEINHALCDNLYSIACIDLREFGRAEECLNKVIDVLKRMMKNIC